MSFFSTAWAQGAQEVAEKTLQQKGIFEQVLSSDPVVKIALLILLFFSVVSWAIIFYKIKQVKQAQNDSQQFWTLFSRAKTLAEVTEQKPPHGPLYEIFNTAGEVMKRLKSAGKGHGNNRDILVQRLTQTREEEIYKLEQYTPFLATTASTAPFVGLFGTVWGILTAFWNIGKEGSSTLAVVGPYIAEALIATAIGLAAAIPAVVAYNHFSHRIKVITRMMDLFLDDLVLKVQEERAL